MESGHVSRLRWVRAGAGHMVVGIAAIALTVSACSGGSRSHAASTPKPSGLAAPEPQSINMSVSIKYSECMRMHGVSNFPNPGPGGSIMLSPAIAGSPFYATASKTCQPLSSHALSAMPGIPANPADALRYAKCMRAHGVPKFPLPSAKQGFNINGQDLGVNLNGPVYKAALSACQRYDN